MNTEEMVKRRKEKGLTQVELARLCMVSQSVIARYENGIAEPSLRQLSRIAEVLGCSMKDLVE